MTLSRTCAALLIAIVVAGATQGAEPKRSRVFTNAENGLELRVVVNTDGAGRTEVLVSLKNAGNQRVSYSPVEKRGVPSSLIMLTAEGTRVPWTDRGRSTFSLYSDGAVGLGPGEVLEGTYMLEDMFVCGKAAVPLKLVAQRMLRDDRQNRWIRLEVMVPDVRSAVEKGPLPTDD